MVAGDTLVMLSAFLKALAGLLSLYYITMCLIVK
jgi:hypothetical protein